MSRVAHDLETIINRPWNHRLGYKTSMDTDVYFTDGVLTNGHIRWITNRNLKI